MAEVKFHFKVDDSKPSFAVVIARMNCRWVLCKHRDRTTHEFPGGIERLAKALSGQQEESCKKKQVQPLSP